MIETPDGDIHWALPFKLIKRDAGALEIGAEVIGILNTPVHKTASPADILKETGFKTWEDFTAAASLISAELKGSQINIQPYFSGIDGEFCAVLNRERTAGLEPYEVGHALVKSLEYCR